jgi:transposase
MLTWFKEFRNNLQSMLRRGKVKLVTEAVPLGEVQLGADAMTVMSKIRADLSRQYHSDDLARLLKEGSISYTKIQEKYARAE